MSNFNLPPGCTDADVDRAMGGDEPRCWACSKETDDLEREWFRGDFRWLCNRCEQRANEPEDDER